MITCKKCGKEFDSGKFCPYCGEKTIDESETKTNKNSLKSNILDIIFKAVGILIAVMAITAVFLPLRYDEISSGGIVLKGYLNFDYWFTKFFESDMNNSHNPDGVMKLVEFGSFAVGTLLAVGFGITAIIKNIISLVKKDKKPANKSLLTAVISSCQYFIFVKFLHEFFMESGRYRLGEYVGPGYYVAIVALFLYAGLVVMKEIQKYMENKQTSKVGMILNGISIVLVSVMAVTSFGPYTGTNNVGVYSISNLSILRESGADPSLEGLASLFTPAFIVSLFGVLALVVTMMMVGNLKKMNSLKMRIVLPIIMFATNFYLIFGSLWAYKDVYPTTDGVVFYPIICGVIFSLLILGLGIASIVVEKKQNK